jgi:signal transduction histidine kinase
MTAPDPSPAPGWWRDPATAGARTVLWAAVALIVQLGAVIVDERGRVLWALLGGGRGPGGDRELVLATVFAVLGPLMLLAARRAPGTVVLVTAAIASLDLALADGEDRLPLTALLIALVLAVVRGARVQAWIAVVGGLVVTLIIGGAADEQWSTLQVAGAVLLLVAGIGLGEVLRSRVERERERERATADRRESAVRAERESIARELHDVLAHSLSQIAVQAGVGLHLSTPDRDDALERARIALTNVREASTTALDDVRRVIGVLRLSDDAPLAPEPGLDAVASLVEPLRAAEVDVRLTVSITSEVPRAVQAAAYRIVQESLTNVLRHAGAAHVDVRIATTDARLTIEVVDDGGGTADRARTRTTDAPATGGLGITGMAERAALLGGTLQAGPHEPRGFRVRAELPIGAEVSR